MITTNQEHPVGRRQNLKSYSYMPFKLMFKFKTYENHLHGLGVPARCPVPGET